MFWSRPLGGTIRRPAKQGSSWQDNSKIEHVLSAAKGLLLGTIRRPANAGLHMACHSKITHGKPYMLFSEAMAFSVYVLELKDGSYYVGFSDNLERRLREHTQSIACAHTKKIPIKRLLWHEKQPDRKSARIREKEIKGWRREKKERLWESE